MKKLYCIHGDVSLYEVDELPTDAKKVKWHKGFILEKGEGVHTHVIEDECDIYIKDNKMYLKIETSTRINHEEHGVEVLEPKKGGVRILEKEIEREFDYETEEARKTID